jgi:hypothetical protein
MIAMKVLRIWHPILMGLIPILSAYLHNQDEVGIRDLILPVTLTLGVTAVIWALLAWRLRSIAKAAPIVSVGLFCFFNFDRIDKTSNSLLFMVVAASVALALLTFSVRWVFRNPKAILASNSFLNVFSALVVAALLLVYAKVPVWAHPDKTFGTSAQSSREAARRAKRRAADVRIETAPTPARLPDIYYVILDGYARSDVLRDIFHYDNSGFLDWLRRKGFYVAGRSTSNYCQTALSLSSSLNCAYHDRLAGSIFRRDEMCEMMRHSAVIETLAHHGYHLVSFETDFAYTEFADADVYLSPPGSRAQRNEFHALLLDKTPLRLRTRTWSSCVGPAAARRDSYTELRERTNFVFDSLGQIVPKYSPKFVFAHVICPHPPFVFGENGEDISPHEIPYFSSDGSFYNAFYGHAADYIAGYRRQVAYATKRAQDVITKILQSSREPPIIILQSDHGSGSRWNCQSADPNQSDVKERMSILNAYYLPDGGERGLYESITPVNSFRLVLNNYFGAKLSLLPDRNYLSSTTSRFEFVEVSSRLCP